jgi:hypothetical protein
VLAGICLFVAYPSTEARCPLRLYEIAIASVYLLVFRENSGLSPVPAKHHLTHPDHKRNHDLATTLVYRGDGNKIIGLIVPRRAQH